jgi:hypothetical protein
VVFKEALRPKPEFLPRVKYIGVRDGRSAMRDQERTEGTLHPTLRLLAVGANDVDVRCLQREAELGDALAAFAVVHTEDVVFSTVERD